jgi:hypothetical protein
VEIHEELLKKRHVVKNIHREGDLVILFPQHYPQLPDGGSVLSFNGLAFAFSFSTGSTTATIWILRFPSVNRSKES